MSMYLSYFGFKERPFHLTPDPRYLFLTSYHKEALEHLEYGIQERMGFIAIIGGIGTGKTTLCRALIGRLDGSTRSALIFNPFLSDTELLKQISREFGIEMDQRNPTQGDYLDALNRFLLETFSNGGNAVLLVDEAQNLSPSALEQIRVLSNLETEQEKLIQIALIGQPELKELLSTPSLKQLDDRILVRYTLGPLDARDVRHYIAHRLVVAGGRGDVRFTRSAYKRIYDYTGGNPRRINAICDRALLAAYTNETHSITGSMVSKVIREVRGEDSAVKGRTGYWIKAAVCGGLLASSVVLAGYGSWIYREDVQSALVGAPPPAAAPLRPAAPPSPPPPAPRPEAEERQEPAVVLDARKSLSMLFHLSETGTPPGPHPLDPTQVGLVSFELDPEYHVMLKRPFRVRLEGIEEDEGGPFFLVVSAVMEDQGIIVKDAEGRDRNLSRAFVLDHWGGEVSWICPLEIHGQRLVKGMRGLGVQSLQRTLAEIGYLLEPSGAYDQETSHAVMAFQKDFGLAADGIVGPRTRALLYAISE